MRRFFRRTAVAAMVTVASAMFATSAHAALITIGLGNFAGITGSYTYSNAAGTLTGAMSGNGASGGFTFDTSAQSLLGAPAGSFFSATLTITATRSGDLVTIVGQGLQPMSGTIAITDGATNLLTVTFTDATLIGAIGGTAASLIGDSVNGTVSYTSDVMNTGLVIDPRSFTFSLTDITPALAVGAGKNFKFFTAQDTANFSGSIVPEPVTLGLLGFGMTAAAAVARRRRKN